MKLDYVDKSKNDWFLVTWTLSNKCNYRCSYCADILHSGSTGWPKWPTIENFIENFHIEGKKICFRISGGEPTYWKHFIDLAKLIKSKGHTFSFLTNGSRPVEYFKEIESYTDGMILSFHKEYADVDHFSNIIKSVNIPIAVNLMLDPSHFDEIVSVAKVLYDSGENVAIWPKIILDKTSNPDYITNTISNYTAEQTATIKNWPYFRKLDDSKLHRGDIALDGKTISANELMMRGLNQHAGWTCWAGLHMISIDMWGDIYRGECQQGGKIGNLENYTLPTDTIICGKQTCNCLSDIYLKKES